MKREYCVFDTSIGSCALAWREAAESRQPVVLWFQLPEATPVLTESRIAEKSGACKSANPPEPISALMDRIRKHLAGELQDFRDVPVELSAASPFARRVLEATREIPPGRTSTYGELARSAGRPDAARAVGLIMGSNPVPLIIPCHRVVAAGGKSGGFSAYGGCWTKAELLAIERAGSPLLFRGTARP
ncbi:MAG: methylated-DNA--[protein]-cysteine S-methyltransferase [Candidatus Acidiferrales bacterium]